MRPSVRASASLVLLLAFLAAPRVMAAEEMKTWSRDGVRFSLQYPASLHLVDDEKSLAALGMAASSTVDTSTDLRLGILFLLQVRPFGSPGINPTFNVGTQPAGKDIRGWSPEKYAQAQFDAMPQLLPAARNIGSLSTTTVGGLTFWSGTTEFVVQGVQMRLRNWSRYEAKDKLIYSFSFSDEAAAFDEHVGLFESILATVTFGGKATAKREDLLSTTIRAEKPAAPAAALPATSASDPVPGKDYVEEIFITWEPATTDDGKLIERKMRANALLVNVPRGLDTALRFPRPLAIKFAETGVVNAWYAPDEHSVTMTYDLGVYLTKIFMSAGHPLDEALQMASDASVFILMHEMGHAVIGELQLPTTGKEEDSADEFATLLTAMVLPDAEAPSARAAAEWFDLQGAGVKDVKQLMFWDEHSLDRQRTYRILANLFAHSPKRFRFVEKSIPAERLQEAQVRWPDKPARWARLLAPWREQGPAGVRGGNVPPPGGVTPPDAGHFRFVFGTVTDPRSVALQERLRADGTLDALGAAYDRAFVWPRDYTVVLADLGDVKPSIDLRKGQSVISLAFVWSVQDKLMAKYGAEKGNDVFGAAIPFLLMQEVSRAMLHEMQIAFTGEEEDAAAELTALALGQSPGGREMAAAAAAWYQILADEQVSLDQLKMWSPSSLDPQRFYDLLGWLHAGDPSGYAWVEQFVPAARLDRFAREYKVKTDNWGRHLIAWGAGG